MRRPLPTVQEAARILAARRPRPLPAPPPAAGRALTSTLKALENRFGHGADGLKARWRDIVGADLARRTEPNRLVKARIPAGGGEGGAVDGGAADVRAPTSGRSLPPSPKTVSPPAAGRRAAAPQRPGPPGLAPADRVPSAGATLELRVEGPSAAIIQHRAADIISRVNLFLGAGAVARLRIVQGPLRGVARQSSPAPANGRRFRAPLDAAAEQALAADLGSFAEGPLKAALARLGREVMRGARAKP